MLRAVHEFYKGGWVFLVSPVTVSSVPSITIIRHTLAAGKSSPKQTRAILGSEAHPASLDKSPFLLLRTFSKYTYSYKSLSIGLSYPHPLKSHLGLEPPSKMALLHRFQGFWLVKDGEKHINGSRQVGT